MDGGDGGGGEDQSAFSTVLNRCVVVVERGVVVIDGPGIFSSVGSVVLQRRGINTVEPLKPKT